MTSSGNKHQRDYRFLDSFLRKNLKVFVPSSFLISRRNNLQAKKNFPIF